MNPEAVFININNGRQHKTCLPFGGQFLGFLVPSLCIVHKINSKMAISVFMVKAWFLKRQKACLWGLLFAGLWSTFSLEIHLSKKCCEFHSCPWKDHTRNAHRQISFWTLDISDHERQAGRKERKKERKDKIIVTVISMLQKKKC